MLDHQWLILNALNAEIRFQRLFFRSPASRSKIFSLFQADLTNLFEINRILAVKLNQSFTTLYELPYYEYSEYLNMLIEEAGSAKSETFEINPGDSI